MFWQLNKRSSKCVDNFGDATFETPINETTILELFSAKLLTGFKKFCFLTLAGNVVLFHQFENNLKILSLVGLCLFGVVVASCSLTLEAEGSNLLIDNLFSDWLGLFQWKNLGKT